MPQLTLTEAEKDKSFEAHKDDLIVVRLPENPTTGYKWAIEEIGEGVLRSETSDFVLSPEARVGGGGERRLKFKAKKVGVAHVELKLARSWEESSGIDRYGFTIQVR